MWDLKTKLRHTHRHTSISILCQTESELIGRALDLVARGWSTATPFTIWVPVFSCINVVGHDAIVIIPS